MRGRRRALRFPAAALLALAAVLSAPADAQPVPPDCLGPVTGASYADPTDRYPHGALSDPWEWGTLELRLAVGAPCPAGQSRLRIVLPDALVFEDVAPWLVDLDADGSPEALTVESHRDLGARLAIWGHGAGGAVRLAATPHIGRSQRWLAQLGAADLDGDGRVEIAYVDRPHLAKVLRVWRYDGGTLTHVADHAGLTNHRFGEPAIQGGIRDCGTGPEIVTADADWRRIVVTRLSGGRLDSRTAGAYAPDAMDRAMACRN